MHDNGIHSILNPSVAYYSNTLALLVRCHSLSWLWTLDSKYCSYIPWPRYLTRLFILSLSSTHAWLDSNIISIIYMHMWCVFESCIILTVLLVHIIINYTSLANDQIMHAWNIGYCYIIWISAMSFSIPHAVSRFKGSTVTQGHQ